MALVAEVNFGGWFRAFLGGWWLAEGWRGAKWWLAERGLKNCLAICWKIAFWGEFWRVWHIVIECSGLSIC